MVAAQSSIHVFGAWEDLKLPAGDILSGRYRLDNFDTASSKLYIVELGRFHLIACNFYPSPKWIENLAKIYHNELRNMNELSVCKLFMVCMIFSSGERRQRPEFTTSEPTDW